MSDTNNMRQLASCYESGCGVPQDREWRAKAMGLNMGMEILMQ